MKKHISTIAVVVIFICGLSLFLYPTLSNLYNEHLNEQLIGDYQEAFADIQPEQYTQAKIDAQAYQENRHDKQTLAELGLTYDTVLNVAGNGIMGYIEIPKINVSLVIYHTTDEDLLQNGIGHVEESSLPIGGADSHAVLAGHTGLPSAKLLTNIDHLRVGDKFYIHVLDEVLEYQIDDIVVVEPNDTSRLNVVSGKDYVTLVTCTPYGVNSHRLLVRGVRADDGSLPDTGSLILQNDLLNVDMEYLLTFSLLGVLLLFFAARRITALLKQKTVKAKGGENDATDKTADTDQSP